MPVGCSGDDGRGYGSVDQRCGVNRCGVNGVTDLLDDGVEAVVIVGGVLDHSDGAVGLVHAVGTLDDVSVALLVGRLDVTGVGVVNAVVVGVLRVGLWTEWMTDERRDLFFCLEWYFGVLISLDVAFHSFFFRATFFCWLTFFVVLRRVCDVKDKIAVYLENIPSFRQILERNFG